MEAKQVLCIDDDPDIIKVVQLILARSQIDLIAATSAQEGLTLAQTHCPDAILLDIMLPDMEGEETLHRLRACSSTRHIPVVIFSAMSKFKPEARIDGYLAKPFTPQQLLKTIKKLLGD